MLLVLSLPVTNCPPLPFKTYFGYMLLLEDLRVLITFSVALSFLFFVYFFVCISYTENNYLSSLTAKSFGFALQLNVNSQHLKQNFRYHHFKRI